MTEIQALKAEIKSIRSERTALLVNEQNLEEAVKRARVDALTDAAAVCRMTCSTENSDKGEAYNRAAIDCENAIESVKGTP